MKNALFERNILMNLWNGNETVQEGLRVQVQYKFMAC